MVKSKVAVNLHKKEVTLGLIQMSMNSDPKKNLAKAIKKIEQASKMGAQIVCLPELFTTPYFPQIRRRAEIFGYAEKIPGIISKKLSQVAKENKIVLVAGSIFERAGKNYYNTSLVFSEGGRLIAKYRKVHIPHDPGFYERHYFKPGKEYKVVRTRYGNIGVMICYDQWFPEAARANALLGADILFYPTAIGRVRGVKPVEGNWQTAWESVQIGHAIANATYVAAVNRVGTEKNIIFWGDSFVSDSFGKILKRGSRKEEIIIVKCDLGLNKKIREGWGFFYNRKPETYRTLSVQKK